MIIAKLQSGLRICVRPRLQVELDMLLSTHTALLGAPLFCIVILTMMVVFLRALSENQVGLGCLNEYKPKSCLFRLNLSKLWSFPQTRYLKVPPLYQ